MKLYEKEGHLRACLGGNPLPYTDDKITKPTPTKQIIRKPTGTLVDWMGDKK